MDRCTDTPIATVCTPSSRVTHTHTHNRFMALSPNQQHKSTER